MSIKPSIGTATANSYVSVASANTYFTEYYQSDAWDEITNATSNTTASRVEKESLLIQATREIDNTYRFFSSKYNQGALGDTDYQNLSFPRSADTLSNGDLFIQPQVKEATYQQAIWVKLRRNKRFTSEGTLSTLPFFSSEAYNYIKGFISRQVLPTGTYPWQGSSY
jgi:hypothetical protein